MLDFRVLGPLEITRDGARVEVAGQRQRAVLALLLLNANRVVPTERLVDELWGEQPPRTAVTSLHNALSQLRKLLGGDALRTRPPGYVLHVEPERYDLARFERLLARAREAQGAERAQLLREALEEWRGPPLAELAYEAFAQSEVRRLEELRVAALEDRMDADLEAGRHSDLVPELETLVAAHPHRERLRGQLMRALYRSGRQANALQAYQDARRELAEGLGIDPGPALRQLHAAILRQAAGLEDTPAANGSRPAPASDHLGEVVEALVGGRLVVVLGTVAAGHAATLAERFRYPPGEAVEMSRVSQYAAVTRG